jgi:hypothetical protein
VLTRCKNAFKLRVFFVPMDPRYISSGPMEWTLF